MHPTANSLAFMRKTPEIQRSVAAGMPGVGRFLICTHRQTSTNVVEGTMFIALYRWKVKEGHEKNFLEGWHRTTEEIYQHRGSLGSRLHWAEDGLWVAYAQWPDSRTYDAAQSIPAVDAEARRMFRESIEESYPDIYMSVVDDLLQEEVFTKQKGEALPRRT